MIDLKEQETQAAFLADQLNDGEIDNVRLMLQMVKGYYAHFPRLLADQRFRVRAGVYVLLQELAETGCEGCGGLDKLIEPILHHKEAVFRADAATALGVIGGPEQVHALRPLLSDPQFQVAELAAESINEILERYPS